MAVKFTTLDLNYILTQILMAEAGQPPVNPLLSFGLRTIDGTGNNLVAGQSTYGATDQTFPTVTDPLLQTAQYGTSYASTSGLVVDAQPRMISNLISDQTANNPAAVAAQAQALGFLGAGYQNTTTPGADGVYGATTAYTVVDAGVDGIYGNADDNISESTGKVTGRRDNLLHNVSAGADGVFGIATAYTVISNGANGLGSADDIIDEWGANGKFDGNVAGSDDIIGTRGDLLHTLGTAADGTLIVTDDVVSDDIVSGNLADPTKASSSSSAIPGLAQSLFINNVTPDNGLSAPANSLFTFFGQFFDHGLDMIDKGGNGTVFIPLSPNDSLYNPASPQTNFMVLTRATDLPGPDGILGTADDIRANTNQTSPFVDQSQTYASDPSHQVFLREYMIGVDGKLHSTGALLGHPKADGTDGMATWGDLKANAAKFLGIQLTDADVGNVPLLATDAYGNFIPGAHGMPQLVVRNPDGTTSLVEGNVAHPISTALAVGTGHAFINDMAQAASSTGFDQFGSPVTLIADTGSTVGLFNADGTPADPTKYYDNELLDAHYVAGDGRVNENIGLTAIQDIFHSEHDRLLKQTQDLIQSQLDKGDTSFAGNWVLPGVDLTIPNATAKDNPNVPDGTLIHHIQPNEWNGERLFQAAKFGTETEYQHLVFEDFARYVAPSIHVAAGVNVHIDAAITSEFANVVYRFGHSMLDENVNLYVMGSDGTPVIDPATGQPQMTQEGLIQAFTNPMKFASDPNMTADIVLGTVNQVSNAIDEFVTGSLRNNLLGLPLDLAALNIARGRDTGVAPLNLVRNQLFAETGEAQLAAYKNWADFGSQLKHPESLVNFIAAYGIHRTITANMSDNDKRTAAWALIQKGTIGLQFDPSKPDSVDAYNFMHSQGAYANNINDARAIHSAAQAGADGIMGTADDIAAAPAAWSTGSVTGVDNIDMWVGGLAEKISLFGGKLGSTFEYIFRTQMEALQDGDRLYYLPRIEGMDYEATLQDSSLSQLIAANTGIKDLPGNIFVTPEYTIEASTYFNTDGSIKDPTGATWLHSPTGQLLVTINTDNSLQFLGENNFLGNTIVLNGTTGNDKLIAGAADDDTVYGNDGNDYIDGGGGADFLFGGDGNDTIIGGQGDDTMHGDAGNDTMYGGDGIDNMFGGDGNDYMEGGRGDDILMGGLGNDILIGNEGQDQLIGGEGDDWLESKGGQGDLMFGDSGAPTGGLPLYSGNDVMIGGVAGGDVMKGFSGDDIMVGGGSFTKFIGGLGFDWGSYENALSGVSEDMNRKEFITPSGLAADSVRDIWQHTEGASGSAFDDNITGTNNTKLLATKDELDNVNLITGLSGFFDAGFVSFDGGDIILGGAGNDTIKGGAGNDIIDGDAWLHVALTSYTAGAQIIRSIQYDPNGNTYDPTTGLGTVNAANVDTAVYTDIRANYNIALFGPDAEGFLTIQHVGAGPVIVGGNPQGLLGGDDGTDRIRHIERLQFADGTVAIDSQGNLLDPTVKDAHYDAVPISTPSITESGGLDPATTVTTGQTLTASVLGGQVAGIKAVTDADGIATPITWQWQENDLLRGQWVDITGATQSTFTPTIFQNGALGIRVEASYIDGKGYRETVTSASTAAVSLPDSLNTAPTLVVAQQFNGVANTTAVMGQAFDYFSPFTAIFTDQQTPSNALKYSATMADGSSLASVGLSFQFDPVTGAGEFKTGVNGFVDASGNPVPSGFIDPDENAVAAGDIGVRVTATDTGPTVGVGPALSVTSTFFINLLPLDHAPVANNDSYSILEDATLNVTTVRQGVLANDMDPDFGDRLTAQLMTGPAHGALVFNKDGTFTYTPTLSYKGSDSFTYVANDAFLMSSNVATVSLTVTAKAHTVTAALVQDSGASATDGITNNAALSGKGYANAAVFATVDRAAPIQFATADATGAWTGTPVLADGLHTIVVSETDGNPLSATFGQTDSATVIFTLDTTPPLVSVALVADTGTSATDNITQNPALTGVGDANSSVVVHVTDGAAFSATTVVQTAPDGTWTLPDDVADGTYTVTVTGSTDLAGNTGHANLTFTKDTIAPAVTEKLLHDTGASASDLVTNDDTITGFGDANATVFAVVDGAAAKSVATAGADGAWQFTPVLADGTHTVAVTETDLAGNSTSKTLTFTLDKTPPPVTVALANDTGSSATDRITRSATMTGTGDPGATVQVSIDGVFAASVATSAANATSAGGRWTFVPIVTDGPHIVSVTETDLAGNTGTASLTFTLDTQPPAAPAIANLSATPNALQTALTNYTISGTAEAGATVALSNGVAALGTATAAADGSWTLTVTSPLPRPPLANFNSTLTVTATDVAGNTSGAASRGLIVGTVANNTLSATGSSIPTLIIGLAGSDSLTGGSGNDTLDGGSGSDAMAGGAGNDTYFVDNVGDVVTERADAGIDQVLTSLGSYNLTANVENLTYTGTANFNGKGNALANVITAGAGGDTLDDGGLGGSDTLIGGAGNDTYIVANVGDTIIENAIAGGTDTVLTALASYTLGTNVENLTYTGAGGFTGTGNTLANVITGGAGADTLDDGGVGGSDTLVGGAGDDTYIVANAGDAITEAAGGGTDTVRTALASYTLGNNVENLTYTGAANFIGKGNTLGNVITGGAGADTLDDGGAGGPDRLVGGAGDDTYIVANVGDVIAEAAGGGTDTVRTALASYTLGANVENLTYTGAGSFTGKGNALANVITGGAGADTLNDGLNAPRLGVDTLIGGAGNDTYIVSNVGDVITELAGGGTDSVRTGLGSYTLDVNVENLTFIGAGAFTGTGNASANVITGGTGNDTLNGGAGADTLIGGSGADIFTLVKGEANGDLINDFSRTEHDFIQLSGYVPGASLVKGGTAGTTSTYAVQVNGVTQDTFKVTSATALTLNTDFRFV